jgi:hypothetical protein
MDFNPSLKKQWQYDGNMNHKGKMTFWQINLFLL